MQRVVAVVLALLLVATVPACRKRAGDTDGGGGLATDGNTTTTLDGGKGDGTGTTTTAKPGTPTTSGRNQQQQQTTTTGRSGSTPTTNKSGGSTDTGAKGGPGAYARTLLRPQPVTQIVVEVFQQANAHPLQHSLDHALSMLKQVTGKQVALSGPVDLPGSGGSIDENQIKDMADRYSKVPQSTTQAVVHLLFLNGSYKGDTSVLGISVRGDTAALMVDQVARTARMSLMSRSVIEDAVTEHELGHLLGLVDLVLQTGRQDPKHPGHSRNEASVMYYAIESDVVSQVLKGPPPVDFDDADRADLATIRSGG